MNNDFEVIIDVQSRGAQATIKQIERAEAALDELNRTGQITTRVNQSLTRSLADQKQALSENASSWSRLTKARKEANAASSALTNQRTTARETQNLTSLEAAERRVTEARRERKNATAQLKRAEASGDDQRILSALQRQTKAVQDLATSEKTLDSERSKSTQQQAKAIAQQDRVYNDYLEKQFSYDKKQADAKVRLQERQSDEMAAGWARLDSIQKKRSTDETAELRRMDDVWAASQQKRARDAQATHQSITRTLTSYEQAQDRIVRKQDKAAILGSTAAKSASRKQAAADWDAEFASLEKVIKQQNSYLDNAISIRYANYDVASTMLTLAGAIAAVGTGAVVAFSKVETALAQVQRTTGLAGDDFDTLSDQLVSLGDNIGVSFEDIASMATKAGELGVASDQIESFTEVVSKFAATADDMNASDAATALARIGNLTGTTDWEALASAIASVAVEGASSYSEITKTAQEIAQAGAASNLAADEIVGLASAFASLGVPPERARSVIQDLISVMNKGLAGQNESIATTARLFGTTADEVARLWKEDPAKFIQTMAASLSSLEPEQITTALSDIGLEGKRAQPVFAALAKDFRNSADGASVLNRALANSKTGFQEATEVNRQFAIIAGTLGAQWQEFLNTILTTAAAIGAQFAPAIGSLLGGLQEMLIAVRDFVGSDFGGSVVRLVGGVIALVGAWAALRGIIALASASTLGLYSASRWLTGGGLTAAIGGLGKAFLGLKASQDLATVSTSRFTLALKAFGKATVILAIIQMLTDLGGTIEWVGQRLVDWADFLNTITGGTTGLFKGAKDWAQGIVGWGKSMQGTTEDTKGLTSASKDLASQELYGYFDGLADSANDAGGEIANTTEQVRTLSDYANDLASVWSRAFEIRFSSQSTLDSITSSFNSMRDAADATRRNIQSLNAEIGTLNSDINIQTQFLSVAQQYGDATRAQAIQAKLAELEDERAKKLQDLTDEQGKNNKTLVGNSKAAIENRNTITGLVQQYQAHIQALANSGLSTDELQRRTALLEQDFITQATQLGYNRNELGLYTQAFYDVKVAIDNVPRNITVTADTDPAIQALNEFVAKAAQAATDAGTAYGTNYGEATKSATEAAAANWTNPFEAKLAKAVYGVSSLEALARDGVTARLGFSSSYDSMMKRLQNPTYRTGFAGGGFTGSGGKYEPAGVVHRGEYVVPKHMVNQSTGLPYADALGRLQRGAPGRSGYSGGGLVTSGGGFNGPVALSAGTIQQLAMVMDKVLSVDGRVVGDTASRSYARGTALGRS